MKKGKFFLGLFIITLCQLLLFGCEKETLPILKYLLSADVIENEISIWRPDYIVKMDESSEVQNKEQSLYNFYSGENEKLIVGVKSLTREGERFLDIVFNPPIQPNAVSLKESKSAIAFATRLFGGFESESIVYDHFIKEYGMMNTEKKQLSYSHPRGIEGASIWESTVDGIVCQISLEQPKLKESEEYICSISFISDWDKLFPNSPSKTD